jgi:hypothetical protein
MKPATTAQIILLGLIVAIGALALVYLLGCTIKVEPLPKPKPVVVHHYHRDHRVHHSHSSTPASAIPKLQPPDESNTKLLPRPTP